ncbi:MAG: hypothetical protein GTN36_01030 [Candidatus Aenigmarchaeota archaeon]|nr:hypothetical protein [Candidatus Aenigmarchaeota archaeon]
MVKNPDLERIGKYVLRNIINGTDLLQRTETMGALTPEEMVETVIDDLKTEIDEKHRLRLRSGPNGFIDVYDFKESNGDGVSTKELYNEDVHKKELMYERKHGHSEQIIKLGIIDDRFGYYFSMKDINLL